MHEMDTVARREDPAKPTSGLDAKRVAAISSVSAKALDDLWQRAMKNSPRGEGLRDNNLRKAARRIVKEITARRNPISFDDTEFESSLGDSYSHSLVLGGLDGHVIDHTAALSGETPRRDCAHRSFQEGESSNGAVPASWSLGYRSHRNGIRHPASRRGTE
jgi:hypothetical protein